MTLDVKDRYLKGSHSSVEITGREFTASNPDTRAIATLRANNLPWAVSFTYTISEDGSMITQRVQFNDGSVRAWVYTWQR